ncbi:uncharacterized protein B0I36DRAFT_30234 [Microdochium trichocladiopsis]|uniref:Uncharacterized protein n=1 Tax=Microdochium trichocladiopsis TaxID=1682393 RepID=A0A9P9BKH7_9PEZI|nr:uncharacterized protein B0I36DRAFT_30234 [Microdochium trichocladiopsis]KAH7021221.1 hypothetical protein B0I36DRAFT_30234 [Microdochium trichocladiopsis]
MKGFRRKKSNADLIKPAPCDPMASPVQKQAPGDVEEEADAEASVPPICRPGYSENKCRNVLVRYCAHIPRNYQYKDGIQRVFLVLREHLGDENLDLAGGVLYELIEIDCEHTDDAGAAYQRWRYDHMWRHSDFELPHVPHMTTITPSIVPTPRLAKWRATHPERYPFVLSDSAPVTARPSSEPSCIRSQKAWLIDNTFYISSRQLGTRPVELCSDPKEFHKMQWATVGQSGRLVQEREVTIAPSICCADLPSPTTIDAPSLQSRSSRRRSTFRSSRLYKLLNKTDQNTIVSQASQRRHSWIPSALGFESDQLFSRRRSRVDLAVILVPLPDANKYQNGIFARKNMLVEKGNALPPYLPLGHMPTAETKATESMMEAAQSSQFGATSERPFRGPFTPQLGFDGGLDFQWSKSASAIKIRRFDVSPDKDESTDLICESDISPCAQVRRNICALRRRRRRGVIFDLPGAPPWGTQSPNQRVATRQGNFF